MARIESPAGDMELTVRAVAVQNGDLVVQAALGMWESRLIFSRNELVALVGLALGSPRVLRAVAAAGAAALWAKLRPGR